MTQKRSGGGAGGGPEGKGTRAERLAAELRANLRRRKEQARARSADDIGAVGTSVAAEAPGSVAPDAREIRSDAGPTPET